MKPIKRMKDENGEWVTAGDRIVFSFGIPPRFAHGTIKNVDGVLWLNIHDAEPHEIRLRSLRKYVGLWWKEETE